MPLMRGRLFAGALFAGALFGVTQVPEAEAVHYGSRKHEPLTFEYLRARDEYLALRRAPPLPPVAQPEATSPRPTLPITSPRPTLPITSPRPTLPVTSSKLTPPPATSLQPLAQDTSPQLPPLAAVERRKDDEEAILLLALLDLL